MKGAPLWIIPLALCVGWTLTSCVVRDGPFETVIGNRLDKATLARLEMQSATVTEVIAAFGPPADEVHLSGSQVLVYRSVRERKSRESIGGFEISESSQRFIEVWELKFKDGKLYESQLSSRVEER